MFDTIIAGILQQRMFSCLEELDILLTCSEPVVECFQCNNKEIGVNKEEKKDIITSVKHIMSLQNKKAIPLDTKLSELGMDSLIAVEIRHVLEQNFDINLTANMVKTLTFSRLLEIQNETKTDIGR